MPNVRNFPGGTIGWTGSTMRENQQEDVFIPCDSRLVAVNVGPDGTYGSLVYDTNQNNEYDAERSAYLQSAFRVIKKPLGDANAIAFQLNRSGNRDTKGGYFVDIGDGSSTSTNVPTGSTATSGSGMVATGQGAPVPGPTGGQENTTTTTNAGAAGGVIIGQGSFNDKGPFHVGNKADKHNHGVDADGNPINSLHITTEALFYRNQVEDGPLRFEKVYKQGQDQNIIVPVHLAWAGEDWAWWSTSYFYQPDNPPPFNPFNPVNPYPNYPFTPNPVNPWVPTQPTNPAPFNPTNPWVPTGNPTGNFPGSPTGYVPISSGGNAPITAPPFSGGEQPPTGGTPIPTPTGGGTGGEPVPQPGDIIGYTPTGIPVRQPPPPYTGGGGGSPTPTGGNPGGGGSSGEPDPSAGDQGGLVPTMPPPGPPGGGSSPGGGPSEPPPFDPGRQNPHPPGFDLPFNPATGGTMNVDGGSQGGGIFNTISSSGVLNSSAQTFQAQNYSNGAPDNTFNGNASSASLTKGANTSPMTGAMSSFAAQGGETAGGTTASGSPFPANMTGAQGDPFRYTRSPRGQNFGDINQSRYRSGTANGGIVYHPIETDLRDIATNGMNPPGVTLTTFYVLTAPNAYFGCGVPELVNGGIKNGFRWGVDASTGNLDFSSVSSSQAPSKALTLTNTSQRIRWYATFPSYGELTHSNSSNRTYNFPDKSGTVALTSDVISKSILGFGGLVGAATGAMTRWGNGTDASLAVDNLSSEIEITSSGTLRRLRVTAGAAIGVGNTVIYTVRINGVDSSITCSLTGLATSAQDYTNTAAVIDGDQVEIKVTVGAGIPLNTATRADLQLDMS